MALACDSAMVEVAIYPQTLLAVNADIYSETDIVARVRINATDVWPVDIMYCAPSTSCTVFQHAVPPLALKLHSVAMTLALGFVTENEYWARRAAIMCT